jgi:hypothetical protein
MAEKKINKTTSNRLDVVEKTPREKKNIHKTKQMI